AAPRPAGKRAAAQHLGADRGAPPRHSRDRPALARRRRAVRLRDLAELRARRRDPRELPLVPRFGSLADPRARPRDRRRRDGARGRSGRSARAAPEREAAGARAPAGARDAAVGGADDRRRDGVPLARGSLLLTLRPDRPAERPPEAADLRARRSALRDLG